MTGPDQLLVSSAMILHPVHSTAWGADPGRRPFEL